MTMVELQAVNGSEEPVDERKVGSAAAPFTVRERVRWSDVDAAGIVCYGMYLRFFELAESEMFLAAGLPVMNLSRVHGLWLVRRRIECDFLRPVALDEELAISVSVGAIGRTSLELVFFARRMGEQALTAEGRYVLVAVDRESLQPISLPDAIRTALQPYRLDRTAALVTLGVDAAVGGVARSIDGERLD